MPAPWEPDFDFYFAVLGEDPASVTLDLGATADAPLADRSLRLRVVAHMQAPRPDGLRSNEEVDALVDLEDDLVETCSERFDAIYIGRVMFRGIIDHIFYLPDGTDAEAVGAAIDAVRAGYTLDVSCESDPEWEFYRNFLYPNPYQFQSIHNRRLLGKLRQHGDDGTRSRRLDHVLFLPNLTASTETSLALEAAGYAVDAPAVADDGQLRVEAHRDDAPAGERIDEIVGEILDVLLPLGGWYDGWGCAVT